MGINISEIVQGSGWKNFMKYLYGWGAAVVLAGALFKLQHWTGASAMLTIGMTVEVVIFFFSAFEPIHDEVDWTLVYPELAGMTDEEEIRKLLYKHKRELNIKSISQYDIVIETKDGQFFMVENKKQEYFKAPPFDAHQPARAATPAFAGTPCRNPGRFSGGHR